MLLSHVYVLVHVGPGPLYVRRILTAYWQDVDYPACRRMRPVWTSGGSHNIEEWWDNQMKRQRERGGHMSGQRTMTINCLSQLTWTQHYQDQIIYSTAQKCGTNIHAAHTRASDKVSTSPWSLLLHFIQNVANIDITVAKVLLFNGLSQNWTSLGSLSVIYVQCWFQAQQAGVFTETTYILEMKLSWKAFLTICIKWQ